MMRAILMQNQLEQDEEEMKKDLVKRQKLEMRKFLQSQMTEKK